MNIYGREKLTSIDESKTFTAIILHQRIKELEFKKGQRIKMQQGDTTKKAKIVEVTKHYIVVNYGKYRECFLKKDLARKNDWRFA